MSFLVVAADQVFSARLVDRTGRVIHVVSEVGAPLVSGTTVMSSASPVRRRCRRGRTRDSWVHGNTHPGDDGDAAALSRWLMLSYRVSMPEEVIAVARRSAI